ncbi:TonB-dependent receptor [Vulcaniibacterium tengchongense]|uniref:TonB-dependent receptor n=1 Tax=Vulcaniibacterium tengchongense TaxID=1273429 RepID=A0A3N4V874_9GAMM|nr:TonB-dependent receptor [Vulcaniibacterium tengchongense]RPE75911.1 TonB-dependent receptor [Vulcaniibacterium tengchongense]
MLQLKRNLLSAALASATLLMAAGAQAQDAAPADQDATDLDTVVVTGIRAGIEGAISTKKESTSIVEAISAEDIGKLPDISIAESIARLPGISAQRVGGRAQVISVRGLSPDFATTLLNGREMVSTGDNRSVEFDQYPAELMSGVTVYKTPDAGLVGQGLSGTIDMRTVRPLDYSDPVVAVSGRLQRNSLGDAANADDDGNRINASYIGQFADRTLGLSIGYSHTELPIQENQVGLYEPWRETTASGDNFRNGVPAGVYFSDGIKALRRTGDIERDAVMATLQYRPSNDWTSTLDLFHSKAEQEDTANQFEVNLSGYNGVDDPDVLTLDPRINGNGTFTGGTATNVYPLVRGMYRKREDKIEAVGWNNDFNLGPARVKADIGWSRAEREELLLENNTQMIPRPQLDNVHLSYDNKDFSQLRPGLDYSNPEQLFLTNTIYGSGYGKVPRVEDELKTYTLAASLPAPQALGWLSDIDVGLNYADRQKQKTQPEGNINLGAQGDTPIARDLQYGLVNLGFAGVGYIPSWNVPAAIARYMSFEPRDDLSYLIPKAWTVDEKLTTGYVRANIDAEWGPVGVRGNIGVQIQHADQSSRANYWDGTRPEGSQVRPIENGKTYTDYLPSLNLAFLFPHDQTLRLALARQVARPRVDQLRASLEFGVDTTTGRPGASGGNPELDPWRANAFDISYEKYFGNKAYVAAAYFYKDLRSYIYTQTNDNYDFSDFVADYVPAPGEPPTQTRGNFTAPYNGQGGKLQGLELSASIPLDLLWAPLQGFGVVASASFNDSDIKIVDPDSASSVGSGPISLPGLSDEVYNLTAYFERGGFEARVSQRKRSDFIGEIGNFDGNRTLRYVVGEDQVDAQIRYTFGETSSLAGLTLLFEASNLTNSPYQTYAGTKDRPLEYIEWGRTYLLGLSYKF